MITNLIKSKDVLQRLGCVPSTYLISIDFNLWLYRSCITIYNTLSYKPLTKYSLLSCDFIYEYLL